jgi:hypothetical protein
MNCTLHGAVDFRGLYFGRKRIFIPPPPPPRKSIFFPPKNSVIFAQHCRRQNSVNYKFERK